MPEETLWKQPPLGIKRGDIVQLGKHRLMCGDSTNPQDVEKLMQGEKVALAFADPPYGLGIDTWDKAISDVPAFLEVITDNLQDGGFFAFTHQMPYMVEWLYALQSSRLRYKDHIAWVKRNLTGVALPLLRNHESLFIYGYGKAHYHQTKGRYEDVKLPGVLVDVISLQAIDRYIKDLHLKIKRGTGTSIRDNRANHHPSHAHMPQSSERSPEFANFTNVWSFLPENQRTFNKGNINHPTAKPTLLLERLLELTTPQEALVFDAFLGSGTTLLAAETTGRTCIGMERSESYCGAIIARWQSHTSQQAQLQVA